MIIYFTGTGNSKYIAQNLCAPDERMVSVADLIRTEEYTIKLADNEPLGLVFPVYFYTLPQIVDEFLRKADIQGATYVYSVITCGGGTGQASAVLKKRLAAKGIRLSYFREILMPDNGMLFYQIGTADEAHDLLAKAQKITEEIKADLLAEKTTSIKSNTVLATVLGAAYKKCSGTKKFYAEDTCIGCGLCEKNCPQQVIRIVDNRPVWQKESCCKCSACINRCPVKAIQYGKGTKKRNRYYNPMVK